MRGFLYNERDELGVLVRDFLEQVEWDSPDLDHLDEFVESLETFRSKVQQQINLERGVTDEQE